MDDSVELELRPRFPLFGGWKTQYYIGYNVPSYEYLYNKGRLFTIVSGLKMFCLYNLIHQGVNITAFVYRIIALC